MNIFKKNLENHFGFTREQTEKLTNNAARILFTRMQHARLVKANKRPLHTASGFNSQEIARVWNETRENVNKLRAPKYRLRYEKQLPGDKYGHTFTLKTGEIERGTVTKNLP